MATKAPAKKVRVTAKQIAAHRESSRSKSNKDHSPNWEGSENWSLEEFNRQFYSTMNYFRMEADSKSYKLIVLRWLNETNAPKEQVLAFKKIKDHRVNSTMAGVANSLMRGMPAVREGWNGGANSVEWLKKAVASALDAGREDIGEEEAKKKEEKSDFPQMTIQDRLREAAIRMTEEIEDALEQFAVDHNAFDPKQFKILNLLKGKGAKAAHARIIRDFYNRNYEELSEALEGKDDQLKEGYAHISKANLKKITSFYGEIVSACDMLMAEAKVNRAPRAKKPTDKAKVVSKLKFLKQDEATKQVSINPVDIIGSKELWVFNIKTRKLGRYVAADFQELGVKGTTITGFDEAKSVQKTLRKPAEQLKEFKAAGKVALRKFLDDIKAVDIKLNGRINDDVLLLKTG